MTTLTIFCLTLLIVPFIAGQSFNLRSTRSCFSKHKCEDCKNLRVYAACRRFCRTFCAQWYIPAEEIPYVNDNLVGTSATLPPLLEKSAESAEAVTTPTTASFTPVTPATLNYPRFRIPDSFQLNQVALPAATEEPQYNDGTEPYYDSQEVYDEDTTLARALPSTTAWNPFGNANEILQRLVPPPVDVQQPVPGIVIPDSQENVTATNSSQVETVEDDLLIPKSNISAAEALAQAALAAAETEAVTTQQAATQQATTQQPQVNLPTLLQQLLTLARNQGLIPGFAPVPQTTTTTSAPVTTTLPLPSNIPPALRELIRQLQKEGIAPSLPKQHTQPEESTIPPALQEFFQKNNIQIGVAEEQQRRRGSKRRTKLRQKTKSAIQKPREPSQSAANKALINQLRKQVQLKLRQAETQQQQLKQQAALTNLRPKPVAPPRPRDPRPPNDRFLQCCQQNPRIPQACYSLCNFQNMNAQQAVAAYLFRGCGPEVRYELLTCGSSGKDHRRCCLDNGVPQECSTYCYPSARPTIGGGNSLSCLNIINPLKFCFETYMRYN